MAREVEEEEREEDEFEPQLTIQELSLPVYLHFQHPAPVICIDKYMLLREVH